MKKNILILASLLSFSLVFAQTEKEKVEETVNKSTIEGHIYFLADDLLKGRETGTDENKIAASYLANTLRSYGVKPNPMTGDYYQKINMKDIKPPRRVNLSWGGKENKTEIKNKVVLEPAKMTFTGEAVYLGFGTEEDFKGKNLRKKIVILQGGDNKNQDVRSAFRMRQEKSDRAKAAGALAVIELIKADAPTWGFVKSRFDRSRVDIADGEVTNKGRAGAMGYLWVQDEYGAYVNDFKTGTQQVKLKMEGASEKPLYSSNVVGVVEGTDPQLKNEYIIYSAHYDHVGIGKADKTGDKIYNGARDNAVGVTTVLSMAQNLAKYPTKRSALFILFTAEEKGLLGSKYYVDNPVLPLEQMVYCFNSDNGGYNDTSIATIVGLNRTTASGNIISAAKQFGLQATDDPAPEQGLFDRSDNVNFAAKGIPAPTFSLGFTAFDEELTKYYHQPGDHADSLDYDYLEKFFRAYVMAGRNIANDPETPFWVAGDKYETAGKKLYRK